MSTEAESGTGLRSTEDGSVAMWVVAPLGLWVLITPFFWGGPNAGGFLNLGGGWLYWSNIVTGVVIAALGAYGASAAD